MKPKQWLFDNGHIADPKQRGRMSLENKMLIEQAVRDGVPIEGYGVSTVQSTAPDAPVSVSRVSVDPNRVLDVPDERRPESVWDAHTFHKGEKVPVGMRTVCNTCGNSLNYCPCRSPYVWIDFDTQGIVTFTSRR